MTKLNATGQQQCGSAVHFSFAWGKVFSCAVLLIVLLLGCIEAIWRAAGYSPTVYNTPELWVYHRRQLSRHGFSGVAILGSSRMLAAFSTDAFRERYPRTFLAQLAIQGSSPVKAFEDLALDPKFAGTIICEFLEPAVVAPIDERHSYHAYLDSFHRGPGLESYLEVAFLGPLQERLCCFYPELSVNNQLRNRVDLHRWQHTRNVLMRFDRRQLVDYEKVDLTRAKAETLKTMKAMLQDEVKVMPSPEAWLNQALRLEPAVRALQSKGGRAVFVVLPCTGSMWDLEKRLFPKTEYWDRFAAATSAVAVHFRDLPALAGIECPDGFHLDFRQTDEFTDRLLDELAQRGLEFAKSADRKAARH
jgi:hypothetical protein